MDKLDLDAIARALEAGTFYDSALGRYRDAKEALERLRAALPVEEQGPRPVDLTCAHCRKNPATCIGRYEGHGGYHPACDECCGHGNEDGFCRPPDMLVDILRDVNETISEAEDGLPLVAASRPLEEAPLMTHVAADRDMGRTQAPKAEEGKAEPRPGTDGGPLAGCRWRYSEGYLFCGTMRVMRDDWDTQPAPEVRQENMAWVCRVLNAASGATPGGLRSIEQAAPRRVTQEIPDDGGEDGRE